MNNKLRPVYFCTPLWLLCLTFAISQQAGAAPKFSKNDSLLIEFARRIEIAGKLLADSRYKDGLQEKYNNQLLQMVDSALQVEGSQKFGFDSVTQISIVKSEDGLVRLFTWFTLTNGNEFKYYGFIQYYLKADKKNLIYKLTDAKPELQNPEGLQLTHQNWFGALYYELIENKSSSGIYYTLLGWDGNNQYSTKKVIDVLLFTETGKPKFGKAIFKVGKKKDKRLIFEFNKRATMMINFDKDLDMIVFDHLAPINNQSGNNPAFWGPDLSYDGLKFTDDFWEYQSDIDYKPSKRSKKNK